jgi:hypothetical protein
VRRSIILLMRIAKFLGIVFCFGWILVFVDENFAQTKTQSFNQSINLKTAAMEKSKTANKKRPKFYKVLDKVLPRRGLNEKDICNEQDAVQLRILNEYGSIFIIGEGVVPPPTCMFNNAVEVNAFQQRIFKAGAEINGTRIELQTIAMQRLQEAREEALKEGLEITPRGGFEAARRSFEDTLRLWKTRFEPALAHWLKEGRLSDEQVEKIKSLPIKEQVREVLELESQGIYFNTWFNNSILYSVAAPGTSQHLSMLALDVREFRDEKVRKILAKHGWFRTVQNDAPHFTFLGRRERDLRKMGLKKIETKEGEFWIPDLD